MGPGPRPEKGLGFRVWGLGSRVQGLGFRGSGVWGLGVWGLGIRVEGFSMKPKPAQSVSFCRVTWVCIGEM